MLTTLLALGCVIGISIGQLLFKASANELAKAADGYSTRGLVLLFTALAFYGLITLAWVWLLKSAELGKIYPFMALAFVLVPLGSHYFFGEAFTPRYFIGIGLIMAGIVVTSAQAS